MAFFERVEQWIRTSPLDAITFTEAVILSRSIGTLLALGVTDDEIRQTVEAALAQAKDDASLLSALEQMTGHDIMKG